VGGWVGGWVWVWVCLRVLDLSAAIRSWRSNKVSRTLLDDTQVCARGGVRAREGSWQAHKENPRQRRAGATEAHEACPRARRCVRAQGDGAEGGGGRSSRPSTAVEGRRNDAAAPSREEQKAQLRKWKLEKVRPGGLAAQGWGARPDAAVLPFPSATRPL